MKGMPGPNCWEELVSKFDLDEMDIEKIRGAGASRIDERAIVLPCKERTSYFLAARARLLHLLTGEGVDVIAAKE